MSRKLRVAVVFGGHSGEHDVSLRSAQAILRHIDRERFEPVPIGITRDGQWLVGGDPLRELAAQSRLPLEGADGSESGCASGSTGARVLAVPEPFWSGEVDVVFPVLHGPYGEDGTIQGMLELAGLPYVGCGVLASAVAMDKPTAKRLFTSAGLDQARWLVFTWHEWERERSALIEHIERELGFPCFVKPANLGSSVGVSKVRDRPELVAAVELANRYDRRILVEEGIDARELEVSVLGNEEPVASIVGEIVPSREFYDYEAKYIDTGSQLLIPAPISPDQAETVRRMAIEAFRVIDGAGMARVDFFLERPTGRILINEVNTIPGFTAISMYPKLWEASGLCFRDLITRLIELALERHREQRRRRSA
ncbi:D-alanine--D-alanine ligase [Thermomicrobium sp. 4228-Ro]|uniref:D-alanine--D-alanine ligase family protein n=1 Tax=Thermomicrobium sp. 4228-Ro TaxID=2993937 RepID=UPI00224996C8|nr:D-alanine--D-alanine ligase family protein [Thermomicrobium sp. 4228-Ro]MCX2727296.1 D-alanine--D-alanine ligase [Thermomicrobium sp. 4228-Ro]